MLSRSRMINLQGAFARPRRVAFPGHADSNSSLCEIVSEPALFCKWRFLLSAISSWSCNVRAVGISTVSVGLTESCGFGSHVCGTTGDRHCSLLNRRPLSPGIARDFAFIGDGISLKG